MAFVVVAFPYLAATGVGALAAGTATYMRHSARTKGLICVAASDDGNGTEHIALALRDGSIYVTDEARPGQWRLLCHDSRDVRCIVWAPEAGGIRIRSLAVCSDGKYSGYRGLADHEGRRRTRRLVLWRASPIDAHQAAPVDPVFPVRLHERSQLDVLHCAFNGDGTLVASVSTDGTLRIWPLTGGQAARSKPSHTYKLVMNAKPPHRLDAGHLSWSPGVVSSLGHDCLAVAHTHGLQLLEPMAPNTCRPNGLPQLGDGLLQLSPEHHPTVCEWSANSRWLAVGLSDGAVVLLDGADWSSVRLLAHDAQVSSLAWHPDNGVLFTAGGDTLRAVDPSRRGVLPLEVRLEGGKSISCTRRSLVCSSADGSLTAWSFLPRTAAAAALRGLCEYAQRTFLASSNSCFSAPGVLEPDEDVFWSTEELQALMPGLEEEAAFLLGIHQLPSDFVDVVMADGPTIVDGA